MQGRQDACEVELELGLNVPAAHDRQVVCPVNGWYVPAGQPGQNMFPLLDAADPAEHGIHSEEELPAPGR